MRKLSKIVLIGIVISNLSLSSAFAKQSPNSGVAPKPAPVQQHTESSKSTGKETQPKVVASSASSTVSSSSPRSQNDAQKKAVDDAKAAYQAAAQAALDGANRAVADAKSLLDQALTAAGKDKALQQMAYADYKRNKDEIWSAFKQTIADAKSKRDAAIAAASGK